MEKDKDEVSPRGVLDAWARFSDSNKSSGESSKEKSSLSLSGGVFQWGKLLKIWKSKSIQRLASFPPTRMLKNSKGKSRSEREDPLFCTFFDFKSSLVSFTIAELEAATNNFSSGIVTCSAFYLFLFLLFFLLLLCWY